jgi:phasin family protein
MSRRATKSGDFKRAYTHVLQNGTTMSEQTTQTPDQKPSDLRDASHEDVKGESLDIRGMLERFKLPGFDLDGFLESRKLDIDSVTRGTSAAFVGAQTIVEKQADLLKTVLTEVGDALRKLPQEAAKPAEIIRKQQELASEALSSALASMKEIADTVGKSQSEIIEIVSNRVRSNIEEIRNLANRHRPDEKEIK